MVRRYGGGLLVLLAACGTVGEQARPVAEALEEEWSLPPLEPPEITDGVGVVEPAQEDAWGDRAWMHVDHEDLALHFTADMVASLDEPPVDVVLDPPLAGSWRWETPQLLRFEPDAPLQEGTRVTVSVTDERLGSGPEVRYWMAPYFQYAGKVANWPVEEGNPRFVGFVNAFSLALGEGPMLLLFDQPVDPSVVAQTLRVTSGTGEGLATRVSAAGDIRYAFHEPPPEGHVVAVRFPQPPSEGEVTVDVAGEQWTLEVRRDAKLSSLRWLDTDWEEVDTARLPERVQWTLQPSTPVMREQIEQALHLEPEPLSMQVYGWGWDGVTVSLELERGTEYRVALDGLRDALGNEVQFDGLSTVRTRDEEPRLLLPSMAVTVEASRAAVELQARNVEGVRAVARRAEVAGVSQALAGGECVGTGAAQALDVSVDDAPLNEQVAVQVALPPGAGSWCVEVRGQGRGTEASGELVDTVLVQATDLALTAKMSSEDVFAWLTSLDAPSALSESTITLLDSQGRVLASDAVDAAGTVSLSAAGGVTSGARVLVAERGDDRVGLLLRDDRLSAAWQFGLTPVTPGLQTMPVAVFTERGAYRPGDAVQISLMGGPVFADQRAELEVLDARGQQVLAQSVNLDAYGMASVELPTEEGAAVGEWTARVQRDGASTQHRFRVEEYRVPTFDVSVEAPASWPVREPVAAELAAAYLHGGALGGRQVSWEVRREPAPLVVPGLNGFQFRVAGGPVVAGSVASGSGQLDGTGHLVVPFTPDHASTVGPMRYIVDATVTDVDRQAYLGRTSRVVHPADFYVGVKSPSRTVFAAGEAVSVPVVVARPDGELVDDVPVRVRLERVDHHHTARLAGSSAQVLNRPVAVETATCLVRTSETGARCELTLPEAGRYRVRAWARDSEQRDVQAGFELTVSGGQVAAWPRFDHERVELRADKASYAPGDVARLVIESPFAEAQGLLTLERDGVLEHRLFRIDGDTPELEVPITAAHAPNVYASVSLLRGRTHNELDASGFATGAPAFRLGVVELKVEREEQRLAVSVSPDREVAAPGEAVQLAVDLRDAAGEPVNGQAVVMVVDEAVLGLTAYVTPDPLAALFPAFRYGVRTADSRLELPDARRRRHEVLFPGGDGGFVPGQIPANLLRTLFESTAYYNGAVPVRDGHATVPVTLPDNTTTFRVMAVAVDDEGRAGSGEDHLVVRRPLMVQAVLPRFAYPGDSLQIEALLHNGTEEDGIAVVSSRFSGLQGELAAEGVRVPAGGTASVPGHITVGPRGEATVMLDVQMGDYRDAVEVVLPVREPGVARTQVVSTTASPGESLRIELPADRVPGSASMELVASSTSLTELKDAVGYLMGYPNGCIEQTTSRAYPLVMLEDLLPEMGVEVDRAQLREYSEAGVARILSFQVDGGGLSYWPGGNEPHAFATAFGLTALIEAKDKGYDVPDAALAGMGDYLVEALSRGDVTESIPHGNIADGDTRALFVMTLGRLDRPQPAWIERLWQERDKLTPFGLSFLAIAAEEMPGGHPLAEPLLAEVERRAEQDSDEAWYEGTPRGGYSMDSPLRSHAAAMLASATGEGSLRGKYLKGLLERRRNGLWGNTQENVFGVMAVARLAEKQRGSPTSGLSLLMDGEPVDLNAMEAVSSRVRRQTWTPGATDGDVHNLAVAGVGSTPITVTLRASYDLQLSESTMAPTSSGATIQRELRNAAGELLTDELPLGELVWVTLTVTTEDDLNYVAVDDKLPAGLEPLNTDLVTTERVAMGELTPAIEGGLSHLSYREVRDHRVAFYADELPAGTYSWRYVARATTPGAYLRPAARVEAMYDPDVYASSAIDRVEVR